MSLSMLQRRVMPGPPELLVRGAGVLAVVSCLDPVPAKDIRNCRAAAVALEDLVNRQPCLDVLLGFAVEDPLASVAAGVERLAAELASPERELSRVVLLGERDRELAHLALLGQPWKNMRLPPASTRWCFSHVGRWW